MIIGKHYLFNLNIARFAEFTHSYNNYFMIYFTRFDFYIAIKLYFYLLWHIS